MVRKNSLVSGTATVQQEVVNVTGYDSVFIAGYSGHTTGNYWGVRIFYH
jgi:hypothetical protein